MKALLGRLVVLATVVMSCNAHCYVIGLEKSPNHSSGECTDIDGVKHPLNSKWETERCFECVCGENEIQCCSRIFTPTEYDRFRCKKIFHPENCTFTVVERRNPGKTCVVTAMIR
uniref:beta-microseminoprotein n=1 Tax=Jaculus jaculus TaxID=51337 RepID=UPI001E1B1FAC|nr:beta-microseminoprotein [Jaculus jaculus]